MPKAMHTGQWDPMHLWYQREKSCAKRIGVSLHSPHGAPWDTSFPISDILGSFSLSSRDLKPTNILLGDEGQPVLMDLGSMNQACIQVEGSRQALTLQVRESPGFLSISFPSPTLMHAPTGSHDMACAPLLRSGCTVPGLGGPAVHHLLPGT